MLATPLYSSTPAFSPQRAADDTTQYRPVRDLEAFNSLLPPPIEFIEGSSSGALAVPEGKYEPINATPKAPKQDRHDSITTPSVAHQSPSLPPPPKAKGSTASLFRGAIDITWPNTCNVGQGLINTGNTCFLNSALQCLMHTPPLLRVLLSHTAECRVKNGFCMACSLKAVTVKAHTASREFVPHDVSSKLQIIAKHMRKGRQEDSHEFLRYAIDALQKSCLAGYPPKMDPKLAETTWVHRIFGGKLRSRVTCRECNHNSDTFDSILDLSLDITDATDLKSALRAFVAVDYLKGADKYKCERCKKAVTAEKRFTVHEAPVVLTVHLKRFSPLGRKIGHHVQYDERLPLQAVMSEGQFGPNYGLYGVICHAGGGPNSGHYVAYVKSRDGKWWEMNDEMVTPCRPPVGLKSAYILFYLREKGQALEAAVNGRPPVPIKAGVAAGMKKRKTLLDSDDEGGEDKGIKADRPFIGPQLPSTDMSDSKRQKPNPSDPQADLIKKKISVASQPRTPLVDDYGSDSEEADADGPKDTGSGPANSKSRQSSPPALPPTSSLAAPSPISIPSGSFYSNSAPNGKKRKSPDLDNDETRKDWARKPLAVAPLSSSTPNGKRHDTALARKPFSGQNPYSSRLAAGNSFGGNTYSSKKKMFRRLARGV